MSYAPTAKHCIKFEGDGDDGAIIESDTTIFGPPMHAISIDMELRPYRYGSGRAVLFDYAHYDGGAMQSGINIQRWKNDLEVTIAGSVGSMGWAGVGPVFNADQERVFFRVAIQYRVGPPPQCRLIVWRQYDTPWVLPWQNMVLDYPTGVNAQKWSFMRRKDTLGVLPKLPFRGRLYFGAVVKNYFSNSGASAMRTDGYEPTHPNYFSIYGLKEGVGTAIVDTRAREPATIYDGAGSSTWEWIPEHWFHDTEYAGQHPANLKRDLLRERAI